MLAEEHAEFARKARLQIVARPMQALVYNKGRI